MQEELYEEENDNLDRKDVTFPINPSLTFENFVVDETNKFAFLAMKSICENPDSSKNPLFIQGTNNTGKTHLLNACGNFMTGKGQNVIYVTVQYFLNDFTHHLRNQILDIFRKKYKDCDILLIDDIQDLRNKEATQEELVKLFELRLSLNKQVILCANEAFNMIDISQKIKTIIQSGLKVNIQAPQHNTKIEIFKRMCDAHQLILSDEISEFITLALKDSTYPITGLVTTLQSYTKLMQEPITVEFVRSILED